MIYYKFAGVCDMDGTRQRKVSGAFSTERLDQAMFMVHRLVSTLSELTRLTWWDVRQSSYNAGCLLCKEQKEFQLKKEAQAWANTHTCGEVKP